MQLEDIEDWEAALARVLARVLDTGESMRAAAAKVAYVIAEEQGANGDDIVDEFCDQAHDSLYECTVEFLHMGWEGWSEGLLMVDLGPGAGFIVRDHTEAEEMEILDRYNPANPEALREMARSALHTKLFLDFIGEPLLVPTSVGVRFPVTREDVEGVYLSAVDDPEADLWNSLAETMETLSRKAWPTKTAPQRKRLVRAYLDKVLSVES